MWWTPEGERVLRGAEWELFREGLSRVWEFVEDEISGDDLSSWGVAVLDDLLPNQKLALLALVGEALRQKNVPCPQLTAPIEAIIAVIFDNIRASMEMEIALEGDRAEKEAQFFWRRLILHTCSEVDEPWGEDPLPDETCDDVEEWGILIDCFAERILWDYDFAMARDFLDAYPDVARSKKEGMGIPQDYFSHVAPDPTEEQLVGIRRKLREITNTPG
jgi:hypothetical protein